MTEQQQQQQKQHETSEYKAGGSTGGGIAWAGSLMGSQNPNNLGYRYSTPSKRYRFAGGGEQNDKNNIQHLLPSNIQVQFHNRQGEALANASTLDIPTNSTVDDLTALVNSLLHGDGGDDNVDNEKDNNNQKKIPFSFYTKINKNGVQDDVEITTSLLELLQNHSETIKTEAVLQLVYQPLAVFRVRPVTRCTDTMPGHTEAVLHVQFAPHGRLLASGGGDATVRFWDVNTATPKFTCTGQHKNHVLCTAWSPDGQRFVSADKNGVFIVWNPFTGVSVGKHIKAHKQWITAISFEPMHAVTLSTSTTSSSSSSSSSSVPVSDKQSKSSSSIDDNNNIDVDDSALGCCCHRLVTSSKDGTAKIWNIKTQKLQFTLSGHTDSVEACKWGGEGFIYTASRDRTIKVWNPNRGILVRTLTGHGHRINTLALSSDYILRTGPFDYKCWKFDSIQQAHAAAVQKYQDFKEQQQGSSGAMERLVSGSDDYTLHLWHPTESKHAIKRLTGHQQAVNHIAFSPDGRYFASASFDKKVKIWNGYSGDFITTLTGHVGAVYQVAWSADSRHLVTASKDSTSKLWEPMGTDKSKSGGSRAGSVAKETLPGHADEVYALDWSPNGSSVATGSKDRTIKIWKH